MQGAGTPNQAGIGGFFPLSVGDNSVWFLDALANANFADYENNSSIINTDVAGTTISTSSRLGYRWLNGDRSWMYGLDVGYFITPVVNASVGYYYQNGDLGSADGSGVLGRVAYEISSGLTAGVNISYDEAFETRVSADLKVRFGGAATTAQRKEVQQRPVISALTSSPGNRDVRVHDKLLDGGKTFDCPTDRIIVENNNSNPDGSKNITITCSPRVVPDYVRPNGYKVVRVDRLPVIYERTGSFNP